MVYASIVVSGVYCLLYIIIQAMGFSVEESEAAARKHNIIAHAIDDLLAGKGMSILRVHVVCMCVCMYVRTCMYVHMYCHVYVYVYACIFS